MNPWEMYKKWFFTWENATAQVMETWLKSPLVLEPAGAMLSTLMKAKASSDNAAAQTWGAMGVATKRDQERTLHALNQIQSRLMDLEDKLSDLEDRAR